MPNPPPLTADQRQAALEKAATNRRVRADLKERLKVGDLSLPELFETADNDEVVGNLRALSMLEALPGVGKVKARRVMEQVGISESRRVRGLGKQQRRALLDRFAD